MDRLQAKTTLGKIFASCVGAVKKELRSDSDSLTP